jgi:hypothetical protein
MKTSNKKEKLVKDGRPLPVNQQAKVRGSGFTYSENKEPTDKSVSMSKVKKEEIVLLPNLGQKNRP